MAKTLSQLKDFLTQKNLHFKTECLSEEKVQGDFLCNTMHINSRFCQKKAIFIAYQGDRFDGHDFIEHALEKGANIIIMQKPQQISFKAPVYCLIVPDIYDFIPALAEWFYNDPSKAINVIGITGTNGKSTCCHLLAQLLSIQGHQVGVLGTLGNGIWPQLNFSNLTTLDCCELNNLLNAWRELISYVVIEVSSHALAMNRVKGIKFDIVSWTNLTHEHLDFHNNMEEYFRAKSLLFTEYHWSYAVVNYDDFYGYRLLRFLYQNDLMNKVITYGHKQVSGWSPFLSLAYSKIRSKQTYVQVYLQKKLYAFKTRLLGSFNIQNILLVLGVMIALEKHYDSFLPYIPYLKPVKGRMEIVGHLRGITIVIDYAHSPDALLNSLRTLKEHNVDTIWVVFGCGGNRDQKKRNEMAKVIETESCYAIVTEDNSRDEPFWKITQDIITGFNTNKYKIIKDRKEAIEYAIKHANAGDIVLLAGKGHETYQVIGSTKYHLDERDIVNNLIVNYGEIQ